MTVTQADVAAAAGVAPKTVSNVINGYPHISSDVRRRVNDAIERLDYRPNHAARSLRGGQNKVIGLAVPELDVSYFSELARLIVESAESRGLDVVIMQTLGARARELAVVSGKNTRFIDGLIYSPVSLGTEDLPTPSRRLPVVLLGERTGGGGQYDHVGIDNVAAAYAATAHLIDSGRRRVAFIGSQPDDPQSAISRLRLNGYRSALSKAGLVPPSDLVVATHGYHRQDGAAAVEILLQQREHLPDAIFCATDLLALGALRTLLAQGIRVPDDIALIGFDDIEEGRFSTPALSTIAPDKHTIAVHAVERLSALISAPLPAADEIIDFSVQIRESS